MANLNAQDLCGLCDLGWLHQKQAVQQKKTPDSPENYKVAQVVQKENTTYGDTEAIFRFFNLYCRWTKMYCIATWFYDKLESLQSNDQD